MVYIQSIVVSVKESREGLKFLQVWPNLFFQSRKFLGDSAVAGTFRKVSRAQDSLAVQPLLPRGVPEAHAGCPINGHIVKQEGNIHHNGDEIGGAVQQFL